MGRLEFSPYLGLKSKAVDVTTRASKGGKAVQQRTPGQVKQEIFEGYCDSLQRELADIQHKREAAERVGTNSHPTCTKKSQKTSRSRHAACSRCMVTGGSLSLSFSLSPSFLDNGFSFRASCCQTPPRPRRRQRARFSNHPDLGIDVSKTQLCQI
jgi:hypothetical protein